MYILRAHILNYSSQFSDSNLTLSKKVLNTHSLSYLKSSLFEKPQQFSATVGLIPGHAITEACKYVTSKLLCLMLGNESFLSYLVATGSLEIRECLIQVVKNCLFQSQLYFLTTYFLLRLEVLTVTTKFNPSRNLSLVYRGTICSVSYHNKVI